jgi:hypothetical protein
LEQRSMFSVGADAPVPQAPEASQAIEDLAIATATGAVGAIPIAGGVLQAQLGWALGLAGKDPVQANFDVVNAKIDKISDDIAHLKSQVDVVTAKLDTVTRDNLVNTLPFSKVQAAQDAFESYINCFTVAERQAAKAEFLKTASGLDVAIKDFENAFKGTGGKTNLMEAYSAVLKNSASTAPFLTNANYTTQLQHVFKFYKDYETQALNLLVEYYHANGNSAGARTAVANAKKDMTADTATLPKAIPGYAVLDSRTGDLWSTFQTSVMSQYIAQHNFNNIVNGDANYLPYLYNNTKEGKNLEHYGKLAIDTQKKENTRLGLPAVKWTLPTLAQVKNLQAPDQSSPTSYLSYLPSKGFTAGVTNYQIWTSEERWRAEFSGSGKTVVNYYPINQKPTVGLITRHSVATTAGAKDFIFYHGVDPAKLSSGVQAMYVSHVGLDYANARKI